MSGPTPKQPFAWVGEVEAQMRRELLGTDVIAAGDALADIVFDTAKMIQHARPSVHLGSPEGLQLLVRGLVAAGVRAVAPAGGHDIALACRRVAFELAHGTAPEVAIKAGIQEWNGDYLGPMSAVAPAGRLQTMQDVLFGAAPSEPPIYVYRSPVARPLWLPELPEPLVIGPRASVEVRWMRGASRERSG